MCSNEVTATGQMSSCDRLSQASCTYCCNSAMVVAGSGERISSCFIMSHKCSFGERSGDLAGQGSCTLQRAHCIAAANEDVHCPAEEALNLPVEEMAVALGYQSLQCSRHYLLYPAETPNVTTSCNWWPPNHEAWGGACVSWANAFRKMTLTRSMLYTCTSITRIQTELTHINEDNRVPFHSPVDSFTTP